MGLFRQPDGRAPFVVLMVLPWGEQRSERLPSYHEHLFSSVWCFLPAALLVFLLWVETGLSQLVLGDLRITLQLRVINHQLSSHSCLVQQLVVGLCWTHLWWWGQPRANGIPPCPCDMALRFQKLASPVVFSLCWTSLDKSLSVLCLLLHSGPRRPEHHSLEAWRMSAIHE